MNKLKLILVSSLAFLLLISIVFSAPPVTQTFVGTTGLEIRFPQVEYIKLGSNITMHTHVYNLSDGIWMSAEKVRCFVHLYNSTGDHIAQENMTWASNEVEFILNLNEDNFSKLGMFAYFISCNSSSVGGFASGTYQVTNTGFAEEYTDNSMGIAILIFITLLTVPFFIFGLKKEPVLTPEVADFLLKKSVLFLGFIFVLFDTSIILTLAGNAHLGIQRELFRIMLFIQWGVYPMLVYIFISSFIIGMRMFKLRKENQRMGLI